MDNVPVRVNGVAPNGRQTDAQSASDKGKKKKINLKLIGLITGIAGLLAVITLVGWMVYRSSMASTIDNGQYQAVFFTNGQVYFGKLRNLNGDYFKLADVFYLQTQAQNTSNNPQQTAAEDGSNVQLVKLGDEIHGPEDEMIVSKDQVLFFENLKKDGKVSNSINQYVNANK